MTMAIFASATASSSVDALSGKCAATTRKAALGFYVLRFNELVDRFTRLEEEARGETAKGKYIGKVRHMLEYVPQFDGLGDFDDLIRRLKSLESRLVSEVEGQRNEKKEQKESLIRDAERWSSSTEWKTAATEIKALQDRWKYSL
jgi:Domain of Unknown Function (DUF349)